MPAPGSQNHVANHIPSMFSTVQGRSWGVASKLKKILERSINDASITENGKEISERSTNESRKLKGRSQSGASVMATV